MCGRPLCHPLCPFHFHSSQFLVFFRPLPPPSVKFAPVEFCPPRFLHLLLLPLLFLCLLPLSLSLFSLLPPLYVSSCISQLKLCSCVYGDFYHPHILSCLFCPSCPSNQGSIYKKIKRSQQKLYLCTKSEVYFPKSLFPKKSNILNITSCNLSVSNIQMLNSKSWFVFYRHRSHNQQAVSRSNEAGLSYMVPSLSVAVTTLSVSFYSLYCCGSILFCCDVTDPVTKDLESSHLDGKWSSQVLVAYDRLVFFQVPSRYCSWHVVNWCLCTWIWQSSKCFPTR